MNELVFLQNEQALTTSLKVAEYFGKRHDRVLRAITASIQALPEFKKMFIKTSYKDAKGESRPMYLLTHDGFIFVVMGFTGKKAAELKWNYIQAFNAMEQKIIELIVERKLLERLKNYGTNNSKTKKTRTAVQQSNPIILPLEDALISWFGNEYGEKMFQTLSKPDTPQPKCVYILHMSNETVKIGVTQNFDLRHNTISTSSGLEIIEWCYTEPLPSREAYSLENKLHKFFKDNRIKGEFFSVPYNEAYSELTKHANIAEQNIQRLLGDGYGH